MHDTIAKTGRAKMFRPILFLVLLLLISGVVLAQNPYALGAFDITASGATAWVGGNRGGRLASIWAWSVEPGAAAAAPDACTGKIEVCNEENQDDCTGNAVLDATNVVMADCTTKQAVICADGVCAFRWVRANFTVTMSGGDTLRTVIRGQ